MKKHFKTQSIHIISIKYYITKKIILKVKVKKERLKKSKLDNTFGTEGVLFLRISSISLMLFLFSVILLSPIFRPFGSCKTLQ